MRLLPALLLASCASAQQAPFTLDQVLGAAFPSELTAAPTGGMTAWVSNVRGVRNVMIAEPPGYQARKLTLYTQDDGQEIRQLRWTANASAVLYVRGGTANPNHNPQGVSEDVWVARLDSSTPRRLSPGNSPAPSPRGDRVALLRGGQIWLSPLDGGTPPSQALRLRGECKSPRWSPDGSRLAFTVDRGDHSFIAVFEVDSGTLRYLDPGVNLDSEPSWSPDGHSVAFIRVPSNGLRPVREARRAGEPWSIRVASADTGQGREVWRAKPGPGSVFKDVNAESQILWAGGRLVFPWEADGWTHLYSVAVTGGDAEPLTPGPFEVEDAALAPGGREVFYSSNQGDADRRHLWKVPARGGRAVAVTTGQGIESAPAPLSDGSGVAFLRTDARRPVHAAVQIGGEAYAMDSGAIPPDFPLNRMVTPQQVIFPSADGLQIHGQVFAPPNRGRGRAPAVVFFHGGPRRQMLLGWHSMYYYFNAYAFNQYLANAGYVVLSVNFRSGIGYGMEFREALGFGPSGASEFKDVQAAGAYLRSRPDVDPNRIGTWGGSYGGFLAALALARSSDVFRAGVDFHGVHDWAAELRIPRTAPDYQLAYDSSPMAFVKTWRSPVLLIHGDDDPDVQFNQTVMMAYALRKEKVPVEELVFPDEVHDFLLHRTWLTAYRAAAQFLGRHLR